jgi:hypothetical protein
MRAQRLGWLVALKGCKKQEWSKTHFKKANMKTKDTPGGWRQKIYTEVKSAKLEDPCSG